MSSIRILIADDEDLLRKHLKREIERLWPNSTIIGEVSDGLAALAKIDELKPEVVFLDIRMPGLSGLGVAQKMSHLCHVVFVTAFEEYAVEAFENSAIDYLLKPLNSERLLKTIERVEQRIRQTTFVDAKKVAQLLEQISSTVEKKTQLTHLNVAKGKEIKILPINEVNLFIAEEKYTTVVTKDDHWIIRTSLKELEDVLDKDLFWRVHRSTIVRVKAIKKIQKDELEGLLLEIDGYNDKVSVSRSYSHLFKAM